MPHPMVFDICSVLTSLFYCGKEIAALGSLEPHQQPELIVASHRSSSDIIALGKTNYEDRGRRTVFISKDDYTKNAIFGPLLRAINVIPVNRDNPQPSTNKAAVEVLKESSDDVAIFFEGGVVKGEAVDDVQKGAAQIALRSGAVIRPVGIAGGEEHPKKIYRTNLLVVYGEGINPVDSVNRSSPAHVQRDQLTDTMRDAVNTSFQRAKIEYKNRYSKYSCQFFSNP
jgi:1-acyl-sn-glycerol-3-phosphate acyltransferase